MKRVRVYLIMWRMSLLLLLSITTLAGPSIQNKFYQKNVIGVSVEKRKISMHCFGGEDKQKLIFVGGQHGNEVSSVIVLNKFIAYLKNHRSVVPKKLQLCIIPALNIDGYLKKRRHNSNNVDLNRNFKTKDWQKKTYTNRKTLLSGGGKKPLSEPESKAIASLLKAKHKKILAFVNIHCCGKMALANRRSKLAKAMLKVFRSKVKYKTLHKSWSKAVYPVTGTISNYTWENFTIPDVFIELGRKDKRPFRTILPGLVAMIQSDVYFRIK